MAAKSTEKPAQFHRLYLLSKARRQDPPPPDWIDLMTKLGKYDLDELTINGFMFQPGVVDGVATLAIHKPLNLNYLSTRAPDGKTVTDVVNDPDTVRLQQSTAVAFKPGVSAFGICKGQPSSPGVSAVQEFLDSALPPEKGAHWTTNPVMSDSELAELEKARGVHSFTAKFATEQTLMSEDPSLEGPLAAGDRLAGLVGHDVKIELKVSLEGHTDSSEARQGLRDFLRRDAGVLARMGTRTSAKIWSEDGTLEEIILGAHTMKRSIGTDPKAADEARFSALLKELAAVVGSDETRL